MSDRRYILTLSCPDTIGIVAQVSRFLADFGCSIAESNHFNDALTDSFHMRTVFKAHAGALPPLRELEAAFSFLQQRFAMRCAFADASATPKIVIAVSRFGHCLTDLLHRVRSGTLRANVAAVVSNHDDMRSFVDWSGAPYVRLPDGKEAQERAIGDLVARSGAELLVLARYMQVLSPGMCAALAGRCINIHHSFLPSFRGARPYHQAHARGVKLIGATAHYVTTELDEGPIIEQAVERVSHQQTPDDLIETGRDLECAVLARAVRWHLERRVLITGNKTVVFR